jgi:hypothetical protein
VAERIGRDEAGNYFVIDEQGNAIRPYNSSPVMGPAIGGNPLIPGQLQGQGLNNQGQQLQNVRTQQQIQTQPLQNENTAVNIAQGRKSIENTDFGNANTLRASFNSLPEVKNYSEALQALGGALKAPDSPQGDLAVVYSFAKAMDPGSVVREGEMDMANQTASMFDRLKQQYGLIQAGKRLPPEVRVGLLEAARQKVAGMKPLYDQQRERFAGLAQKAHANPDEVVGAPLYDAVRPLEEDYIRAHGGNPHPPGVQAPDQSLATGAIRNEYDPKVSSQVDALIRAGAPYSQAAAIAAQADFPAPNKAEYSAAVKYAKQHPEYRNSLAEATRSVRTTGFQRFAASPAGAFISGAAKAGTLGLADEAAGAIMPGDYATNRDAFAGAQSILANQHPTADLLGQVGGGVAAGIGINSLANKIPGAAGGLFGARTPLPSLLNRGAVAGDTAFGAGYGAGSQNDDRLNGALMGGLTGAGGGVAARGTVNGLASAISPTGGAMRPLYDMGVRPSVGQRMGGLVNNLEEKFQSIPVVGDAIAGTRNRARDQFQIGLFNDSLGQIGRELPKGMKPGHAPHAFAQDAISNAYDSALSNMNASADPPFGQDLGALQREVAGLRPESQSQFNTLWRDSVARRFDNGQIAGPAFKDAISELGKKAAKIRSNPSGDHELADVLDGAIGALKGSASRNSAPEAVQALTAADAAHSRIVRIENASRKAGEPAEFSPSQYNTAVKNDAGGVRNRSYLRGDALNADIAALGTRLGDKVSSSGSIERLAATAGLGGLGYVSPAAGAAFGGLGLLNAPGARNVVTELMAPRASPFFDRTAEQLRQRARLAGMFGAPIALDYNQ